MTGSALHLIRPLGFRTDAKYLKRSGMDYWDSLNVLYYDNFDDFVNKNNNPEIIMTSSKVNKYYTDVNYQPGSYIMFGSESSGIPLCILDKYPDTSVRIPMLPGARCLNLACSVALVLYEALRRQNFEGLS